MPSYKKCADFVAVTVPVYQSTNKCDYTMLDWCYYCKVAIKSTISRHYHSRHWDSNMVKEAILPMAKKNLNFFTSYKNLANILIAARWVDIDVIDIVIAPCQLSFAILMKRFADCHGSWPYLITWNWNCKSNMLNIKTY